MTLAAGTRLGPYEIVAPVGAGGMGEVYAARDTRLDRRVAVKVLPAEVADDAAALARFEREAKAIAALSHPNILAIHDVGRDGGVSYVVTELLDGETLRARLAGGRIPPSNAVAYATQLAEGLAAAHSRGIVHRDLKPENVFLTHDGHVKLLDFGLARSTQDDVSAAEAETRVAATAAHTVMGTVGYMSPEQARGERGQATSDVFSFGVVLHEMLSGRRAFEGRTAIDVLSAVLRDDPPPLARSGVHVSPRLERIIGRCLEKNPGERFQSARDLAFSLSTSLDERDGTTPPSRAPAGELSVVVLPFANLSADPEDAYFSDGLTEELITDLSRLRGLRLVPSAAAFRLKNADRALQDIAREFKARYVLTGRVRKAGNNVRVNAELIDAHDERSLWADRYTGTLEDTFDLQERISRGIAGSLELRFEPARREPDPNAREAFLRGRHFFRQATSSGLQRAVACYEEAVRIDPDYGAAFAALAEAYVTLTQAWDAQPARTTMPEARAAAERALTLDAGLAEAHTAMGLVATFYDWDLPRAEGHFKEALTLNPSDTEACRWYAALLIWLDTRYDDALRVIERGLEHDPNDPWLKVIRCWVYGFSRDFTRWVDEARRVVMEEPLVGFGHYALGCGLVAAGRHREAIESLSRGIELDGRGSHHVALLGMAYALDGQEAKAQECLEELEALAQNGRDVAAWKLHLHAGRGDAGAVLRCLEQAIDARSSATIFTLVHPFTDFVADDPRFHALLRKAGVAYLIGRPRLPRWNANPDWSIDASRTRSRRYAASQLPPGAARPTVQTARVTKPADLPAVSPSIAVLPFTNLSADPEQEYFCDGLAEELTDTLARLQGLRVAGRGSAFRFRAPERDLPAVGRALNVKTVLEGSVRKTGTRLRVNAQLVDAAGGYQLWSQRYDRELDDVFAVQEEIARAVADALQVALLGASSVPLVKERPRDVEAYDLYLKGRHAWQKSTRVDYERAFQYLTKAIDVEPAYARAHAEMAHCYLSSTFVGHMSPGEAYPRARAAALRAVELDPTSAEAHTALGMVSLFFEWDWEAARDRFERAVASAHVDAMGRVWYAHFLIAGGRASEGVAQLTAALDVDPASVETNAWVGDQLFFARRYDDAVGPLQQALALDPSHAFSLLFLGSLYRHQGLHEQSIDALERAVALSGRDQAFLAQLGYSYGAAGRTADARRIIDQLQEIGTRGYLDPTNVAFVYIGLGDADLAVDWLEKAYVARAGWMVWLTCPLFDPLRSYPRFQELVSRMHFPGAPGAV